MAQNQIMDPSTQFAEHHKKVMEAHNISDYDKWYWSYQFRLAAESLLPYLQEKGMFHAGDAVAEIGCAEAGVLAAFMFAGSTVNVGTDIALHRLETGRKVNRILKLDAHLSEHDVIGDNPPSEWEQTFDLVFLRDVIEHLDDAAVALANIKKILKPGGRVFVTFPPYVSPFGGHQQVARNFFGKLPYIHLLPRPLFMNLMRTSPHKDSVEEIERLSYIRFSAKKMEKAVAFAGLTIEYEEFYLLRPVFKMKFGLPTIRITPLKSIPLVKSFFSLEASYILRLA
jgi:SAM-dependent methyltransferase